MGISGLWPILEPTCQPVRLEVLEGKVLAVDVSIWIYQAQLGYPGDVRCPHLALLVSRLCKLLYYKIKPIFVFDGLSVPSMKKKVLNERRLRKHAEEVNLTSTKKRHLLDFATIASLVAYIRYTCTYCFDFYMECYFACSQTQVEIEAIKTKLAAENSKRNRIENNLFDILPGKPIELLDVNDDDDVVLTKKMCYDTSGANPIESLIEERERIRAARLRPSQIPSDSKTFSNFQLQRLLTRSRLNNDIQQMCENLDACDDVPETIRNRLLNEPFLPSLLDSDSRNLTSDDSDDCEFYSKTTMVENHTKRNKSSRNATAAILRSDVWSSDSGTDDFIDVPSPSAIIDQFSPVDEVKQPTENSTNDPSTFLHDIKTDQDSPVNSDSSEHWEPALDEGSQWVNKEVPQIEVSDKRDSECYKDLQDFLSACGFPWIEAPGEAEAQCVQLERAGLVQGVVSDDSDVWAFGVKNVYRHLFSKNKNVQHYESRIIQDSLGLSQSEFVEIAIISGGDYSYGLRGIGVVNAIELLSEFAVKKRAEQNECKELEATHTLENILKWIVSFDSNTEIPEPVSIRRNLGSVILKNNNIDRINSIVNAEVIEAYFRPNVNESPKVFKWRSVDINGVRSLLYNKLGWDDEKFERQTLSALQRWNDFISGKTSYQRHITSYMHKLQQSPDEQRTKLTKRVETALLKLSKRTGSLSKISSIPKENPKPKAPKRKTQQTVKRSKALRCTGISKDSKLSEDSDFDSD